MGKKNFKTQSELQYWKSKYIEEGNSFRNKHYQIWMLNLLETNSVNIFSDKVVADFGCGPRGSLSWIENAKVKIGLDVLALEYLTNFSRTLKKHGMIYAATTETHIPLPDNYVDILFTINSFDHVSCPRIMAKELLRILKPGGIFAASFNLYEPATLTEPQTLKYEDIEDRFFPALKDIKTRISYKNIGSYDNILTNKLLDKPDPSRPCTLWIKGAKLENITPNNFEGVIS